MKPSQLRWKWLLFGLLAVLILVIALIPWLIGDTSRFGDRVAAELSAWTGGDVRFNGPVRVSFLPDVSVRGRIELEDSKRLPAVQSLAAREAKVSLDLVDLLRGRITIDALRLLKPHITLRDSTIDAAAPANAKTLFTTLLGGAPVRVLHVRKGRIMLPGERGGTIKEIYAHLDAGKETGAVSGFGSFTYKDTTVRYSLESGSVTATGGAESLPVDLTLTSRPFRARLSGNASNTAGFAIDGDMQAEIDDGRRFFKWIGIRIPDGDSLKGFSAAGGFHLAGSTLTFDDGTFTLDGNKAVGLLALTPGKPRPFNQPLLQFIDADLRISAAAIDAGALKLGRGGFTITAKQGSVASEVGELELCGGSANGRLNVDLAQAKKQINLVANLDDISLDACLEPLALALPIRGMGTLKTELASEGTEFSQLTGNVAGMLKLEAKDGAVPVDFARFAAGSTPISAEGWSRDDVTAFDQLDADCQLGSGHIWCQSLSMQTPRGTIAGSGDVDVSKQTLDLSLTVANRIEPASASQLTQGEAPKVSIRGSLTQPTIRRADRPTLGEGSLQTNPAGPQVSPR
jgi:AsmA protein